MLVQKGKFDLDKLLVKIKVDMIGGKRTDTITCTASDACKLVDAINSNYTYAKSDVDKQYLKNGYVIIEDKKAKNYVMLAVDYIKRLDIPYFQDEGDNYNFVELKYSAKE